MGINVDIYKPRLDVAFKRGPVPKSRGPVPQIRLHWSSFCKTLANTYVVNGDKVRIIELPLWQITEEIVAKTSPSADKIYIPHKMKNNWWLDDRVLYYMQMVIPNIFSIDTDGWCASSTKWPIKIKHNCDHNDKRIFDMLCQRILENISKFKQPLVHDNLCLPDSYIFFPCQLPHDETIQHHSDLSVESSLSLTLQWIHQDLKKRHLLIKGHPANHEAMMPLKKIFNDFKQKNPSVADRIHWIDNISIHQAIKQSEAVFTVNSGVGLEAILHQKHVFTFGHADYHSISHKISFGGSYRQAIKNINQEFSRLDYRSLDYQKRCIGFIAAWYDDAFDTANPITFKKAIDRF